ncbi:MAG: thiamine pyrophosphate-dependent enzyme [Candidatus Thermoplasmatota archaeon]|jgi:pyruvate/2-oxoacid:ferredoxin oxidoreductase beta subunit|nr:thiamine pyrophosphate-dependent enzyme [Candidatus Thermoplasmatota archaeon]MDP7265055.1 thiamine pyrophosphate-dependent enzyme [Candidatus Thermoplasmatota archaeon]
MEGDAIKYIKPVEDLKWCVGCGHWKVLTALNSAMKRLGLPGNRIVIVTDIGCIGLADRFFTTNAFHGLHGRSVTYATGIKMARPEMTVIVLMGDGGCGIGGTHIVNAARRNIGITLVVANNFNYGMTGCQQSVTTPQDGRTETTPQGNIEAPLDVLGLGRAGQGGWLGRVSVGKENTDKLTDMVHEAILHDGFSLLDVWETCPGAYGKRNELSEDGLQYLMQETDLAPVKEINLRSEFTKEYGKKIIVPMEGCPPHRVDLTPRYSSRLAATKRIKVAGSAGQAIQSAVAIFGGGAILSGLYATQRNSYPITRQSGHSTAESIIAPVRIDYTGMDIPDYLLLLSREGLKEASRDLSRMGSDTMLIAVEDLRGELPVGNYQPKFISTHVERGLKEHGLAISALRKLVEHSDCYSVEAFRESCRRMTPQKYVEANLRACDNTSIFV